MNKLPEDLPEAVYLSQIEIDLLIKLYLQMGRKRMMEMGIKKDVISYLMREVPLNIAD